MQTAAFRFPAGVYDSSPIEADLVCEDFVPGRINLCLPAYRITIANVSDGSDQLNKSWTQASCTNVALLHNNEHQLSRPHLDQFRTDIQSAGQDGCSSRQLSRNLAQSMSYAARLWLPSLTKSSGSRRSARTSWTFQWAEPLIQRTE